MTHTEIYNDFILRCRLSNDRYTLTQSEYWAEDVDHAIFACFNLRRDLPLMGISGWVVRRCGNKVMLRKEA